MAKKKSKTASIALGQYKLGLKNLLDQYKINETPLGSGAFGKVYKAVSKKDKNRVVAIKTISKSKLTEDELKDVYSEISTLLKLDHPNIVQYHETYDDTKFIYLVMDLLEGNDLSTVFKEHARNNRRLKQSVLASFIKQLLEALNHCHTNNIIHRDIKLENIMFDKLGQIYLVDFGLAVQTTENINEFAGTGYYMSPSVITRNYGADADLWALGVVLYYLLKGDFPFKGQNMSQIFSATRRGKYTQPQGITDDCSDFLAGLLKTDAKERLTAAEALDHPWIVKNTSEDQNVGVGKLKGMKKEPSITKDTIDKLQNFESDSLLKREVYKAAVKYLHQSEVQDLKKAFSDLDVDNSGDIDAAEMTKAINQYEGEFDPERLKLILYELDYDNTGKINYTDFITATITFHEAQMTQSKLDQIFSMFDIDQDGKIDKDDLKKAFNKLGREITDDEINLIFLQHDQDQNQNIDTKEFKFMIKNLVRRQSKVPSYFDETQLEKKFKEKWIETTGNSTDITNQSINLAQTRELAKKIQELCDRKQDEQKYALLLKKIDEKKQESFTYQEVLNYVFQRAHDNFMIHDELQDLVQNYDQVQENNDDVISKSSNKSGLTNSDDDSEFDE